MPGLDPGIHRPSQKMDCRVTSLEQPRIRHCERSEAIQRPRKELDCFVASLLAMTMNAA
jgi:hypothetical protein